MIEGNTFLCYFRGGAKINILFLEQHAPIIMHKKAIWVNFDIKTSSTSRCVFYRL